MKDVMTARQTRRAHNVDVNSNTLKNDLHLLSWMKTGLNMFLDSLGNSDSFHTKKILCFHMNMVQFII